MTNNNCFILIRGLFQEQRHWGDFPNKLKQKFPNAEVITLDIPGNGCLHKQTSPNTIAQFTDALRQQLPCCKQLNLTALSMGGMIAIDWMNRYPTEIKSTILVNSSLRNYSPFYHRLRWQNYTSVIKQLFRSADQIEPLFLKLTSNKHDNNTVLLKSWEHWRKQQPVSITSAINQLLAAAKFKSEVKPLHPLLIIASKKDQLVNYHCSLAMKNQWQADYIEHGFAGHDLPLDDPDWIVQSIHRWYSAL